MENKTILSKDEVMGFYQKVLLRFENNIKNPFDGDEVVHRRRAIPVSLMSFDQTDDLIGRFEITIQTEELDDLKNVTELSANTVKQVVSIPKELQDQEKSHYTYYTLYRHLRNSFAHGYIAKEDDCFVFTDYNNNDELTFIAKIATNKFFEYIDGIYERSLEYAK